MPEKEAGESSGVVIPIKREEKKNKICLLGRDYCWQGKKLN